MVGKQQKVSDILCLE